MTEQQNVLAWLKDAHAMEQGGILTLENHAVAAQGYPEVQSRLHAHAEATRQHAILVERCIERLGGHPSALKEAIGTVMGKVQGVANLPAQDTVVKNALGDLAAENFEIASYTSLIAAAEQTGDDETATVCRRILHDEEEMAGWLTVQIPIITRQFLAEQAGVEGQSVQAQVVDKAKETLKELSEQGEELAEKAKRKGKDALITSGALLIGAAAGLLIVRALRSGANERKQAPDHGDDTAGSKDASNDVRAGHDAGADADENIEGLNVEPFRALDLRAETLDLSEEFVQNAERPTVPEPQPEDRLGDMSGQFAESPVIPSLQNQEQSMDDSMSSEAASIDTALMRNDMQDINGSLGSDADALDTALMRNDVQSVDDSLILDAALMGGDVQVVDDSSSSDADLVDAIDAELISTDAPSEDELASFDADLVDTELTDNDAQDLDELASLDADSKEAELMGSDAQSDVRDVSDLGYTEVWLVPGPYSGLGPTGYDNSGDPTGQEVYSRLTQHGEVDASNIEIIIDSGEVLLDGTVDSEETKRLAEEAVATVTGVSRVQNLLQVQASQGQET
ncbi:MAG: Protein YciE [uncultured Chloroflexia bacterium]|uniref:Protein YciE n=1 Tax=uncultured Chloroflexia bacterium TaxID=1672391 RepID=A0A6J4N2X1_9CHLR|nr:MAG: Protein YciE [uncultured Chloroflexia bacterium]